MHEYGKIEWSDGRYYQGQYKLDKKHGEGNYYWPNRRSYKMMWTKASRMESESIQILTRKPKLVNGSTEKELNGLKIRTIKMKIEL